MSNAEEPGKLTKITIPIHNEIRPIKKLKIIGDFLYVMTGKQFYTYDVSDVANAQLKSKRLGLSPKLSCV